MAVGFTLGDLLAEAFLVLAASWDRTILGDTLQGQRTCALGQRGAVWLRAERSAPDVARAEANGLGIAARIVAVWRALGCAWAFTQRLVITARIHAGGIAR